MMKQNIEIKYTEKFGCRVVLDCFTGMTVLVTPNRKSYTVDGVSDEELNALMQESLDKGENVLFERFKDKEHTVEVKPGCDY